jgi:sugar lactone lactonase YvrE
LKRQCNFLLLGILAAMFGVSCTKPADPAPKPPQKPPIEFLSSWGDKGDGPGKLNAPVAFATDSQGKVYFADSGSGFIHKFESSGTPLLSFEYPAVLHPTGIGVDTGGGIYVVDAQRGSILIFFPEGDFLRTLRTPSQPHFSGVDSIAIDDSGSVYAPDQADSRIIKMDQRGRLLKTWKVPQKSGPENEKPSFLVAGRDGSIFVAYSNTGRIEKYSADGDPITSWAIPAPDNPSSQVAISGVAATDKFLITASSTTPRIRVWTLDGQLKLADDLGGHLGNMSAPQIAVTPRGELLVFDPAVPRVFQFQTHLQ